MKKMIMGLLGGILIFAVCWAGDKLELKDEKGRVNYSIGYQIGGDFKRQAMELSPEALLKGIEDALSGDKPLMEPQEMQTTLVNLKKKIVEAQKKRNQQAAHRNLADGEAFLAENGKEDGVQTLPSGLQCKVMKRGMGSRPSRPTQ